jgi:hypothetical protein
MALNLGVNESLNSTINAHISFNISEIFSMLKPLALITAIIFLYGFLIFKFYKYLARRDLVKLKLDSNSHISLRIFLYILNQIVVVPALIFFWFLVMACVLLFMSNSSAAYIMLVSMATIAAIRITSYYRQDLSEELAKLLPLTLFVIFIIEIEFTSLLGKIEVVRDMLGMLDKLVFYLLFAVLIELILRVQQIIKDVIKISDHNRQILESSSHGQKKSYDLILDGSVGDLLKLKEEEIEKERKKIEKLKKTKEYHEEDIFRL